MAARKSCTHLTWAEAKGKVGGSSSSKNSIAKNTDHGKALTSKVISKLGPTKEDKTKQKLMLRRLKRDEEKAKEVERKRKELKEKERLEKQIKPYEVAQERVKDLAVKLKLQNGNEHQNHGELSEVLSEWTAEDLQKVAECRELQLNEMMGLEAIYEGTRQFTISNASNLDKLQELIDEWQMVMGDMDEKELSLLRAIACHPPVSYTIQLTVDGTCQCLSNISDGEELKIDLAVTLLISSTLPILYPSLNDNEDDTIEIETEATEGSTGVLPIFKVEYFMANNREEVCNPDKPLESLGRLEEGRLMDALNQQGKELLPDPVVYEVISTWLVEHLFDYVEMSVHTQHWLERK